MAVPMPNMVVYLLLVSTFGMAFFSAVAALRCYVQESDRQIHELDCESNHKGCGTAQCGEGNVIRGCASDPDYNKLYIVTPVRTGDQCKKSFCLGDLCNNEGLEKTGLKCHHIVLFDAKKMQECVTGHVGCQAYWTCKDSGESLFHGCVSENICESIDADEKGNCCKFCDTDLCNNQGVLKPWMGEKLTTPENEKDSTTHESETKNEENPDPPNGAGGIVGWGQIVIIPIGMMTLVLGAGLLKMWNI